MRLAALATMKIEGDIVEEFVRHTLRFVDHVIVVDNGSLDAARDVLNELQSEGLPLSVWDGEAVPSRADGWGPLARRAFSTHEIDYLLMLDVDEFVRTESRPALEEALRALGGAHGLVPWVTYVPTPDDDADEARVLARVRHRLRSESRPFSKVFVHRSFTEHPGASIVPGNHAVFDPDGSAVSSVLTGVELAHIPVRSVKQLQSKALLGWPQFLALGFNDQQEHAYQWRRLNDRLLNDARWDAHEFFRFAWHYLDQDVDRPEFVLDPLPPTECRYRREGPELLPLAVAFTRQFALAYAARASYLEADPQKTARIAHTAEALAAEPTAAQSTPEAQRLAQAQAVLEMQNRERPDARASLQAELSAKTIAEAAAETQRSQAKLQELQNLIRDMQKSNSWRLTLPIRLAGVFLRERLSRLRRPDGGTWSARG